MLGVLRMDWRDLLFASWPVEPRIVQQKLPEGLEVDLHDSKAWVSLVAFENVGLRPRGTPTVLGVDLPELNLRTYVKHDGEPGIHFLSMEADGLVSVMAARFGFALPYYWARMKIDRVGDGYRFESERRHPGAPTAGFAATYRPVGEEQEPASGSLDFFLLERYRLYTKALFGLARVDVDHRPWRVRGADVEILRNTLFEAVGLPGPVGDPVCHFAPEREVVGGPLRPA